MQPISAVERFLERLLERPTARLFRSQLQPIQIQRRIERAMESERRVIAGRSRVPDRYAVHLSTADIAVLGGRAGQLAADLADEALAFARAHGYVLDHVPTVAIVVTRSVAVGEVRVIATRTEAQAGPGQGALVADRGDAGLLDTRAFDVQPQPVAVAALVEQRPDGRGRRLVLDGTVVSIGRATDNVLVLDDRRVSRHHARLQARQGMLVLTDLDSANGSRVNGVAISEVVLGAGDRIEIGTAVFVVEAVATG
jgi:Protein of unknown function (DUF3662)/Inner membrane component of T3SS, cytoplasmic domain